ncbi:MAG: hypothetical protein WCA00_18775 [Candidatus Acidiferrales bacterium]
MPLYCRLRAAPSRFLRTSALLSLSLVLLTFPRPLAAQEPSEVPGEEIVVNLATGRVIIAVVKDAILIATVENPIESQTHPPIPVELSTTRAGILLGAVDWFSPSSGLELARLDRELPRLRARVANSAPGPHLDQAGANVEATDIESVGQGVFERLNVVAGNLHAKLDWPPAEPVAELILADYIRGYGPEVWQLTYLIQQEMQRIDFYDTHVSHPTYLQIWPPVKGQPHTLVEFQYPPDKTLPTLLDLLRQKDPRIEKICDSDAKMRDVADRFLEGDSNKILSVDATQFLRAALTVLTPPNARQTMAVISLDSGFDWILRPPLEPKRPAAVQTGKQQPQEEEAPSLLKSPTPD